jgi:hypothetical protein
LNELKKQESKRTYTLDFSQKKVIIDGKEKIKSEIKNVKDDLKISSSNMLKKDDQNVFIHPEFYQQKIQFKDVIDKNKKKKKSDVLSIDSDVIQHEYYVIEDDVIKSPTVSVSEYITYENPSLNKDDKGKCMSMHQPVTQLLLTL